MYTLIKFIFREIIYNQYLNKNWQKIEFETESTLAKYEGRTVKSLDILSTCYHYYWLQ